MKNLPLFGEPDIAEHYSPSAEIVLFEGNATDLLKQIPDESIDLIITSPPYNIGKDYEKRSTIEAYIAQQTVVISELIRVLKDSGSIGWQVGNYVDNGEIYPLDILYYPVFKNFGLKLRNRIIWHFEHGLHTSKRFSGRYETLLWLSKTDDYVFNLDPVRIPSKYPGKRHYKGPNKGKPSGNPIGKNPSDVWEIVVQDWETCFWDIPNVKSNHPEKTDHPCQFPVELVERCVLALTDEGDTVLDPYVGVGSSIIAARKHGRKAIGSDKETAYLQIARERIIDFHNGRLKLRPLGKPIHQPSGREKVAQKPEEWEDE